MKFNNDQSTRSAMNAIEAKGRENKGKHVHEATLQYIEDVTSKCKEVQEKVLREILSQNAEAEYLKRHTSISEGCLNIDTYKVPVVTYEHIKPDVQRIVNGDFSSILCARSISQFFLSSGTSGKELKLIPTTEEDMQRRHMFYSLLTPVISKYIQGLDEGKTLYFLVSRDETKTPGGLLARPVLTAYYNSRYFKDRSYDPYNVYTSPNEAILCPDHFQSIYTQLLCGFYQRYEIVRVGANFASCLVSIITFLQHHYIELCHDISFGRLTLKVTNPALRAFMVDNFTQKPSPELAKFIHNVCTEEFWEGIIRKIWPNTKYLDVIVTGSMAQYIPTLNYYSGGLPLVSSKYATSEGAFGINLNPMCDPYEVCYTLMPNMAYFEFLPLKAHHSISSDSQAQLVKLADVEVGQEYELVVTTYAGLHRYRIEDVLCPTGYYNTTPQFKFVRRKNVILSIDADKTTEDELQKAIENATLLLKPYNTKVFEYTSYGDIKTIPGHYVIYWELLTTTNSSIRPSSEVLEQCCLTMEEALSIPYRCGRVKSKSIGPLEIRVVKKGTFDKLRDYAMSRGACIGQYKVPRCVKSVNMMELLEAGVVLKYSSSSLLP